MSGNREQAQTLLAAAAAMENAGELTQAVELYRKAYKLCPELDSANSGGIEDQRADGVRSPSDPDIQRMFDVSRTVPAAYAPLYRTFNARDLGTLDGRNAMRRFYRDEGFLVVDDALNAAEIEEAFGYFARYMDAAANIDVTSKEDLMQCFGDRAVGLVGKRSAGHSRFAWFVRSREAVKAAFRCVLSSSEEVGDDDAEAMGRKLITSFDGLGFFRNPESHHDFASGTAPWLHVDACGDAGSGDYVQGLVNLIDCTDDADAGLVVMPRSHRDHVFTGICPPTRSRDDQVTEGAFTDLELAQASCILDQTPDPADRALMQPFRVPLKAGSMAMWSGRLIHCNVGCVARREPRPEQLLRRLVSYVCLMRDPGNAALTERRRDAFARGRTTTHQPDHVHWVGDTSPQALRDSDAVITSEAALPPGAAELL
eukprot:CAMPEP_0174848592 /NCGR_PEP_ID=MMETSP1114-20130205/13609_1 /TAXON_ID=312471 /ORGANISM="Neobodo designis, Strain CCAP 1951/1" /LENGTH=426 /DNA_ID=CAMNT_0016082895 /DNA_START=31 /DNA_END=1311 /DNA_ORIENTATION=-